MASTNGDLKDMDQTKKSALPSKGEVAFRFIACTTIALALYYTPELKRASDTSDPTTVQADALLAGSVPKPSLGACASSDGRGLLIDAAMKAD